MPPASKSIARSSPTWRSRISPLSVACAKPPRPLSTESHTLNHELVLSNPKVQRLRRLIGRRSARGDEGVLVVEGETLIKEALDAGLVPESLFVASGAEVIEGAGEVHVLAPGVIERVASTKAAQPHIAVFRQPSEPRHLLPTARFVVAAWDVSDPGNLGTMMRSAEAAGADLFVVSAGTVDTSSPKVVRASAGSIFRLPLVEVGSWDELRREGRSMLATSSHRGVSYSEADLRRDIVLVFGNESRGLDDASAVDEWITIPHSGSTESLNVAMACTILCFEVARQRRAPSGTVGTP